MDVTASLRFARVTPRKARLVARTLRGLPVTVAQARLRVLPQRTAPLLLKLLNAAAANAHHNFGLDPKVLTVRRVLVNEGPRLKRYMPRARGVAARILKRTSHIEVVLAEQSTGDKKPAPQGARKTVIVTKQAAELTSEELKAVAGAPKEKRGPADSGAVKPAATPRGVRRLFERKHGGE